MNLTLITTKVVRKSVWGSTHNRKKGLVTRASSADEDGFREMKKWITSHGGYIHPSLTLGDSPTLGVRGVITTSSLSFDEVMENPLIEVPDDLRMTELVASQKLNPLLNALGLPSIQRLSGDMQVAMLLASEKSKGLNSHWFPYIYMLPEEPPCAWMWSASSIKTYFSSLPPRIQESCEKFLNMARVQEDMLHSEIDYALEEFGDALPIEAEDLLWCIAQVQSRAYSVGKADEGVALTPVVDLINHSGRAMPPLGMVVDEVETTCIGAMDPLDAGDELFVNYSFAADDPPLPFLLKFGFIPKEILETTQLN